MRRISLLALIGLATGIALGLFIGWVVWKVEYTNTAPSQLRQDYRDDYIVMVASAYQVEGNLGAARDRLADLNPEAPIQPVVDLTERLIAVNGRLSDIRALVHLAQDLGVATPAMSPYLGGSR
ncbi:MAG: hypothetical protein PVI59_13390 [Anaerolineae bacterium]|jgi:hypothetical protein